MARNHAFSPGGPDPGCILLIDGEHYPPVIARAIAALRAAGERPIVALLVGGSEKLGQVAMEIGIPVETCGPPPGGAEAALIELIASTGARRVVDISDEPVLADGTRTRMASVALWCGATYEGADFRFTPADRSLRPSVPSVGVIGTSKRVGKTAIAGAAARTYHAAGLRPVVIAMGRGGPPEPEILNAGDRVDAVRLLEFLEQGRHAASDYIEDALTSGVATVGAWRAGGGMAGAMAFTNLPAAVEAAERLDPGLLVIEGSGSAVPPAAFDAGVLVAHAGMDRERLCGYFGLYRVLLADAVVLTMCEESLDREYVAAVERCARSRPLTQPRVVCTVFRPHPLADISGKKIWFGTTANERAGPILKQHLERTYGCDVVAVSHALARRDDLRRDLEAIAGAGSPHRVDVLAVELKAAAVDVVTRWGMQHGFEVVFVDNRPQIVGDDETFEAVMLEVAEAARRRFRS